MGMLSSWRYYIILQSCWRVGELFIYDFRPIAITCTASGMAGECYWHYYNATWVLFPPYPLHAAKPNNHIKKIEKIRNCSNILTKTMREALTDLRTNPTQISWYKTDPNVKNDLSSCQNLASSKWNETVYCCFNMNYCLHCTAHRNCFASSEIQRNGRHGRRVVRNLSRGLHRHG